MVMPYEVFTRDKVRTGIPTIRLSDHGRISFSGPAAETVKEHKMQYVILLWDRQSKCMAVKKSDKADTRAYRITFAHKHGCAISAKTFLDHIGHEFVNHTLFDFILGTHPITTKGTSGFGRSEATKRFGLMFT